MEHVLQGATGVRSPFGKAAAVLGVFTLAALPFSGHPWATAHSFLPAMLAVIACFDVMSVYLLVGEFQDSGNRRVLTMSCAYVWSLVTMTAYAAAFPGVLSDHPPLALTPWFYIIWHGSFPFLLGAAWMPWPGRVRTFVSQPRRRAEARTTVAATCLLAAAAVGPLAAGAAHLPLLIHGLDTSAMTRVTAPVVLPLTALSLVVSYRRTRASDGLERWAPVVILVCLSDLLLTYAARHRWSIGWYAGRSLTLVASGVVLAASISALRRAKSDAVEQSLSDSLTGLPNRRSGHHDLQLLMEIARRTGRPLSVLSFDLDFFKQINDQHGHEAGDDVLAGVGLALRTWLRKSDIAARVGGEEFLVILPDTTTGSAHHVAEDLRERVRTLGWEGGPQSVTISVGVASFDGDEDCANLLRRADVALNAAKHAGRNRTSVAVVPSQRQPSLPSSVAATAQR